MLGPSGSGKTTTLRMIAGFEEPDAGTVELAGEQVNSLPPYERDVNTVFQDYALFPHMTVARNVEYGLKVKKVERDERERRVAEALELVRLGEYGERKPEELSGGQRQRVALARAVVNRPRVLLLDEPLGALDLKLREQMQIELQSIQSEVGITFVYVTHDQEEALTMSDGSRSSTMAGSSRSARRPTSTSARRTPSSPTSWVSPTSTSATGSASRSGRRRSACSTTARSRMDFTWSEAGSERSPTRGC